MFRANSCTQLIHVAQEPKSWNDVHDEVECYVNAVLVTLPASDQRLDEIRSELKNDDTLKTVM